MNYTRIVLVPLSMGFALWIGSPVVLAAGPGIDFQREVRPILASNCFQCHGPDSSSRKAGLRLDKRDEAFAQRKNGLAITPGRPEESLLYQRITAPTVARRMPPESSHKVLTEEQKGTLKRWIEEGAPWKEHWAFVTPVRPMPPAVKNENWVRNPIDRFVLSKLEEAGLDPSSESDRRTLIRRVSLDLTGLPPSPAEVDAFIADNSPDAYERVVDRLLASKQFGEHRAHYWLDAARYGDTNGMHYDNYRGGIWPYRDWVVQAFNRNLPYDRFTIEQLAGDLLPNRTIDQQIATGFVRNNVTSNENGLIEEEMREIYVKDRADTVGTVFLGMTIACATCHDHKFDPISQKDHYSLEAFFGNTTEMVMDDNRPDAPPVIYIPNEQDRTRWFELKARRELLLQQETTAETARNEGFERWLATRTRNPNQKVDMAPLGASSELLSVYIDGAAHVSKLGVTSQPSLDPGMVSGESNAANRPALQFDGKSTIRIGDFDSISGDEPFSISTWVYPAKITRHPGLTGTRRGNAPTVAGQMAWPKSGGGRTPAADVDPENYVAPAARGWTLDLDEGVPALRLFGDGGKIMRALALRNSPLPEKTWTHLAFTYDGSRKEQGMSLYVNGVAVPIERGGFGVQNSSVVTELKGTLKTNTPLFLGGDGEGGGFFTGSIADFRVFNRVITESEARFVAAWPNIAPSLGTDSNQLLPSQRQALQIYYLQNLDPAYRKLSEELEQLNAEYRRMQQRAVTAMVMEENPASKPAARLLVRGRYDQPGEEVEASTPSVLPPMASSLPRNRLGLAEWMVDASNPLTARVAVNRFWQEVFGNGIVRTAGDFGSQGDAPSHQELLDWMAVEFRESGWDMKKMYRLLVTSATYRQSAILTPEKLKRDPENRLISRGPRFRMDGEMVRDLALSVSGLLVNKLGGPPVKPYQPAGVWEATSMPFSNTKNYQQDSGENLYRRSLYTLWKRSAPPASMDIFDGPTRESCLVHRERTDTPLQALVTMNDPQFVEAARNLAQGAMRTSGSKLDSQIDFMTTRILARTLESRERDAATRSYQRFLAYYGENSGDGKKLLAVGESKADSSLPVPQFAALTMLANQMLSLDEALNK